MMGTQGMAMKGGAPPLQPASLEAAGGGAATGLASPSPPEFVIGKKPFHVPPPVIPGSEEHGGSAQWQVTELLRADAPDQGTMSISPTRAEHLP
eukprot:COSAG01_NODE_1658_length_9590_cov_6.038984_1_plen_94_part_00